MKIFIDIDETICTNPVTRGYSKVKPIKKNISIMNKLYEEGHEITYWSARGTLTGINWYNITRDQFAKWEVKYHYLILGEKPDYDLLIDDKVINVDNLNNLFRFTNKK